ncbi:MAG: metallophosphoesterase [Acidobacteria bacterium]|nr:metallophosphoesterase [Acidobacteriota bacterium]MCI0567217.1 metallophosphoesterase [Acidobacteriota bacterium]
MNSILLLGDAHLREEDPEVELFLDFLRHLPAEADALYLLGDLFDLWIGSQAFISGSHRRVVDGIVALRAAGIDVYYVEGNRDYHLKSLYGSSVFREIAQESLDLAFGNRRIHLAHGDLVNQEDRPYRRWRRLAKGPLLLGILERLPEGLARGLARHLERRIARTNRRHRIRFPEEQCRRFATEQRDKGADTLVLGHFHQETRLSWQAGGKEIEVFVLPSWREGRRYLRIFEDGRAGFETFGTVEVAR